MPDNDLLKAYADRGSESALAELVQRHVDLVYSAALRQCDGRSHLAQDVSQSVFLELARQAKRLASHASLRGWLIVTTRHLARRAMRGEVRRILRETQAHAMSDTESPTPFEWDAIKPVLDEALVRLSEDEREALFLRFFDKLTYPQIARRLQSNEDTVRKRTEKALERMRASLARRGVSSTGGVLAAALSARAVEAAPSGLAPSILKSALATSLPPAASSATAFGALKTAVLSGPFLFALGLSVVIAGGIGLYSQAAASSALASRTEASISSARSLAQIHALKARLAAGKAAAVPTAAGKAPSGGTLDPGQAAQQVLLDRWKRQRYLASAFLAFQSFRQSRGISTEAQNRFFSALEQYLAGIDQVKEDAQASGETIASDPRLRAQLSVLAQQLHEDTVSILGAANEIALKDFAQASQEGQGIARTAEAQYVTTMVSGIAVTSGTPLSDADRQAVSQLLYANTPNYAPGEDNSSKTLNWSEILAQAPKVLSPAALTAVQGFSGEVDRDILADAADAASRKAQ